MTKWKTTLIQKDSSKKRPLPATIDTKVLTNVENPDYTDKTKSLLLARIPLTILRIPQENKGNKCPTISTPAHFQRSQNEAENIAMSWIDYEKTYDVVLQTWIIECPEMYKISDKILNFFMNATENRKLELTAEVKALADEKCKEVSPQKLVLSTAIRYINDAIQLRSYEMYRRLQIYKIARKINYLIYMDDINVFAKILKKRTGDPDTNNKNRQPGMELDIEKYNISDLWTLMAMFHSS